MTHLTILQRFFYTKIYDIMIDNFHVTVWYRGKRSYITPYFEKVKLKEVIVQTFKNQKIHHLLGDVDLIFHGKDLILNIEGLEEKVKKLNEYQKLGPFAGHVEQDNVNESKDIIHLHLPQLERTLVASHPLGFMIADDMIIQKMPIILSHAIIHEMTHLWHLRKNESLRIRTKNRRRLKRFFRNTTALSRDFEQILLHNASIKNEKQLLRYIREVHLTIRMFFLNLENGFAIEGIANFMYFYSKDDYDYQRIMAWAKEGTKELVKTFQVILSIYEDIDIYLQKHDQDKLNVMYKAVLSLIQSPYKIGAAIPATLFEHGYTLEEIASYDAISLIKEYEKVCVMHKKAPLVGYSPKAEFAISDYLCRLNSIRRRLSKQKT
ncbi:MAG: hypothetical protein KJ601_07410 [Nanoarchaeota archaeon]|nr:hypothetical protein [Nanoarchaeota archaeon]